MQHAQRTWSMPDEVTDPVCGMQTQSPQEYIPYDHEGTTLYFCSEHCLEKFTADPERYPLGKADEEESLPSDQDVRKGTIYTCPMHPEIRQEGPGDCPKCGMALEPNAPGIGETRTQYTCPMHPEVVQDGPGDCPECGRPWSRKRWLPRGRRTANTASCASASGYRWRSPCR